MGIIEPILWVLFILACLLVSAVILLQEGKGGGLGEAFGGAGAQTFGVKAGGIAKFTAYLAVGIVVLAVVITKVRSSGTGLDAEIFGGGTPGVNVGEPAGGAPAGEPAGGAPAGGAGDGDG